jgi:uncharacterized protein YwqG
MSELEVVLQQYAKPAYSAQLGAGEPQLSSASKFGGQPYFEKGEDWPRCTRCHQPQFFICQVDVRECPATGLSRHFGLVSFFYCWKCCPWKADQPGWSIINHFEPSEDKFVLVQMPPLPKQGTLSKLFQQHPGQTSPCSVSFLQFDCFPDMDELEQLVGTDSKSRLSGEDLADDYYRLVEKLSGRGDNYDTIVGGYAEWIQPVPETKCGQCGGHLRQLMQIGSESQANIMFGDAGAAYLLFCENHSREVKLFTQCF